MNTPQPAYPHGLFRTPLGAALLSGALAGGIGLLPMILGLKVFNRLEEIPPVYFLIQFLHGAVLCLGPAIAHRRPALLFSAVTSGLFLLVITFISLFIFLQGRFMFGTLRAYSISVVFAHVGSGLLVGFMLARLYGLASWRGSYNCMWLGGAGSLVLVVDDFLFALIQSDRTGAVSKDLLGISITVYLIGKISTLVLPTLLIEKMLRRQSHAAATSAAERRE